MLSAFRDARKKGHELIRAGGQGGHLQPILSAVGQKRPLVVEIKGFKTGHFWEQKSAPLDLGRYGTRGASRTVEAPQSELPAAIYSLHDKGWSQRRIARELGLNRETVGRYLRLPKPAISTAGFEEPCQTKPAISTAGSTCGAKESMRTFAETILCKVEVGLSAQRIYQDLVEEKGFGALPELAA